MAMGRSNCRQDWNVIDSMGVVLGGATMPATPKGEAKPARAPKAKADPSKRCFLCGKRTKLVRTECCGQWICDDEDSYQLFSYARNSCHRNHRRFTLCGFHHTEEHKGSWQTCSECREDIETEMYVYYGTNDYNFEKLENPPSFEPTLCTGCGAVIHLAAGGYSRGPKGTFCPTCSSRRF